MKQLPLQGTWNVASLEVDGNAMPADGTIVITGNRFQSLGMGATYEGTVKVETAKKPHTIDMLFTKGPEKGNKNLGIFELKGDTWRLCLNMTGKARPKTFSTNGGGGIALETLTRGAASNAKTAKKGTVASKLKFVPAPELEGEWQMLGCVTSGVELEEAYLKHGKRIVTGNDTKVTMMGRTQMTAKFTVDRSTTPMSIDYQLKDGRLQHGIYELAGTNLRVCVASPGADRPADFVSKKSDGRTLTAWKKI